MGEWSLKVWFDIYLGLLSFCKALTMSREWFKRNLSKKSLGQKIGSSFLYFNLLWLLVDMCILTHITIVYAALIFFTTVGLRERRVVQFSSWRKTLILDLYTCIKLMLVLFLQQWKNVHFISFQVLLWVSGPQVITHLDKNMHLRIYERLCKIKECKLILPFCFVLFFLILNFFWHMQSKHYCIKDEVMY